MKTLEEATNTILDLKANWKEDHKNLMLEMQNCQRLMKSADTIARDSLMSYLLTRDIKCEMLTAICTAYELGICIGQEMEKQELK